MNLSAPQSTAPGNWHSLLLDARVAVTTPFRQARMERLCKQGAAPISVLFYHRVADTHPNDWTISRDQFHRHLIYCQERFDLIDLAESQRRIRDGVSPRPAVSITFDDGYAENSDYALPLLTELGIPCTYFVSTEHIRHGLAFPHDIAANVPLRPNDVDQLRQAASAGIEIGLHTRNHVDFSRVHDAKIVRREIVEAKTELEQMIGRAIRYFAFPYGMPEHLSPVAIEAVIEAGFAGFCSAFGGYNLVGRNPFHIRRIHGDPEFARLQNWLSFDPRKVRLEPQIAVPEGELSQPISAAGTAG